MDRTKVSRVVVVRNPQGLHARPAHMLARTAHQFAARVELVKGHERVDGKSILAILTLAATQGTELLLEADGDDALAAVEALADLFHSGFVDPNAAAENKQPGSSQFEEG